MLTFFLWCFTLQVGFFNYKMSMEKFTQNGSDSVGEILQLPKGNV